MADLKINELQALPGANLAVTDELPIADISASETKKITVNDLIAFGVDLIANAEIPSAKISFAAGSIVEASLASGAVTASKLDFDAVTSNTLADQSTCVVAANKAALDAIAGDFVGQLGFTTDVVKLYLWQNTTWNAVKAAGSINTITADTTGIVNITVSTSGDTATVGTSLDNTAAAGQFLAGPTGSAGAVSYRTIAGADLPTATTGAKGGVIINGGGLTLSGDTAVIDNTVTPVSDQLRKVSYNAQGLITASTSVAGGDLPVATNSVVGAVRPGTGLSVDGSGVVNHSNSIASATQNGITFDAQGHITNVAALVAGDIPELPANKLTSGTLDTSLFGTNSITGVKLANASTVLFGGAGSTAGVVTFPTAQFKGQQFWDELNGDLYIWSGSAWLPVTITSGELVYGGTYNATTNLVASVTSVGSAVGLTVGQALPAASTSNARYYLVVSVSGTGTGNAPAVALAPPDMILSNGTTWDLIDVSNAIAGQTAVNISFTPYGNVAATNAQTAIQELDDEKLAKAGGTVTGELLIGTAGSFAFEGSTADAYETYLTATDPTADRTITFPDQSGNVIVSGNASIVNADIATGAAIAFSKLASLTSANILVGNSSNVAASVAMSGDVTISNTGVTAINTGVIVNADINASAAIADTKLATISTANKVSVAAIDIDGASDIGAALADADLFLVDDGGGGTNRKAAASRITDYAFAKVSGDVTITSAGTASVVTGTTAVAGKLQLTNSTSSTSTTTAATPAAVKTAFDTADAALPKAGGTMTGAITFANGQAYPQVPQNARTSAYTLVAADAGKHISITTGGVTIPASIFNTGDAISIYNNSGSNQTITQGSSTTLRLAGSSSTGNRTLAQYGLCTVMCVASNTFVISGAGLS